MVTFSLKLKAKSWLRQNIPKAQEKVKAGLHKGASFVKEIPQKYESYKASSYQKSKSKAETSLGRKLTDTQFSAYKKKQKQESERKLNRLIGSSSKKKSKDPLNFNFRF